MSGKKKKYPCSGFFRGWEKSFETIVNNKLKWFFNHTYLKADKIIVLGSEFKYNGHEADLVLAQICLTTKNEINVIGYVLFLIKLMECGVKSDIILGTTAVDNALLKIFDINKKNGVKIEKR